MPEKIKPFRSTIHFPECRRKMKFCRIATFFPVFVLGLFLIAGIIAIAASGGFSIDNDIGNYLFGSVIMWAMIIAIPAAFVAMGYKLPCIPTGLCFALMSAFIENTLLMIVGFIGVMSCVLSFYYICEMDDLKSVYGYPHFREDCEFEYLRTTKSILDAEKEDEEETEENISEETEE